MKPGRSKGSYSVDADTYIRECNQERRLRRSIEVQSDARPLSWGKCVEKRAFETIGLEYTLCSNTTIVHPEIPYWCGSPDAVTDNVVADLKCPMTLTSFCNMLDPYIENGKVVHEAMTIEALRQNHKDGDKFYWQVVSNGALTKRKTGQIIVYCPYLDELDEIRTLASDSGLPEFYWIWTADNEKLPYLVREGTYKNRNIIEFQIPDSDVELLTERVIECGKQLITI